MLPSTIQMSTPYPFLYFLTGPLAQYILSEYLLVNLFFLGKTIARLLIPMTYELPEVGHKVILTHSLIIPKTNVKYSFSFILLKIVTLRIIINWVLHSTIK